MVSGDFVHYIFLALTNPVEDKERAFNAWYDTHHIPEVVRYSRGFSGGRRYKLDERQTRGPSAPWRYLALYDMQSDDLEDYHRKPWREDRPPLTPFAGLLTDDHVAWIYRPCGEGTVHGGPAADQPAYAGRRSSHLLFELTQSGPAVQETVDDRRDPGRAPEAPTRRPGAIAWRSYVLADHQRPGQPAPRWTSLAVYQLEDRGAAAVDDVVDELAGRRPTSPSKVSSTDRTVWIWHAIADYHAERPRPAGAG